MINLNGFDVITVYVPFGVAPNGKTRPCIVITSNNGEAGEAGYKVFRGTTKYKDKSEDVQAFHYPIKEWEKAGLREKTWIDIHEFHIVYENDCDLIKRGSLTDIDKKGLSKFIKDYYLNKK